jgi:leucyl aminopeptidase
MPTFSEIRVDRAAKPPHADALVLLVGRGLTAEALPGLWAKLDHALGGVIAAAVQRPEFSADAGAVTVAYPETADAPAARVLLVGVGAMDRLDGPTLAKAVAAATRRLREAQARRLRVLLHDPIGERLSDDQAAAALAHGLTAASFVFDRYKGAATAGDDAGGSGKPLRVWMARSLRKPFEAALVAGRAANTARTLGATPPNVAHPAYLQTRCKALARQTGMSCRVINATQAKKLGMGGLLAVGAGGSKPPCMIVLEWPGAGASASQAKSAKSNTKSKKTDAPIMLVGKAITFDTGGYSLKVGGSMKGMKYDKCGGAAVIGVMEAVARLQVKQRVVGLVAAAENMIDTDAYRVDDIITLANGVTVEVTNTDAEGRLVMADALAYGCKTFRPQAVFDLATLTGGVSVALGKHMAGGWCLDEALWGRVTDAASRTGERVWRLPLDHSDRDMMKSSHADLHNSAPVRAAHATQGAAFLSFFVGEDAPQNLPTTPWCHLDIAGTATVDEATPLFDKGPTGFGVRLVADLIANW